MARQKKPVDPLVGTGYASFVSPGLPSIIARTVLAALVLLPPTVLLGATLPAIARYVESMPRGVSWMGFFYEGLEAPGSPHLALVDAYIGLGCVPPDSGRRVREPGRALWLDLLIGDDPIRRNGRVPHVDGLARLKQHHLEHCEV